MSDERTQQKEMYFKAVRKTFDSNFENLMRSHFLDQEKFKEKVKEEVVASINGAFRQLTGNKPNRIQLTKLFEYWAKKQYRNNACKEYKLAQHRLDVIDVKMADIYYNIGASLNKTCEDFTLLDATEKYPEKFVDVIIYAVVSNIEEMTNWIESEKDNIKELLDE